MAVPGDTVDRVVARVNELGDELLELTAALADTYCPPGREQASSW